MESNSLPTNVPLAVRAERSRDGENATVCDLRRKARKRNGGRLRERSGQLTVRLRALKVHVGTLRSVPNLEGTGPVLVLLVADGAEWWRRRNIWRRRRRRNIWRRRHRRNVRWRWRRRLRAVVAHPVELWIVCSFAATKSCGGARAVRALVVHLHDVRGATAAVRSGFARTVGALVVILGEL